MEITLEKIELVKDRTGVTYKEAKDALEAADGNVVDAIISLEDAVDGFGRRQNLSRKDALIAKMKEIAQKGNVSKIVVTKDGERILNIPLTAGLLGTVIAPWGMIAGTVAAFGFKCKIEFIKEDGSVVDLSEKAGGLYEDAKGRGTDLYSELREKAPVALGDLKEKSSDALNKAKDMASAAKERMKGDNDDFEVEIEFGDAEDLDSAMQDALNQDE